MKWHVPRRIARRSDRREQFQPKKRTTRCYSICSINQSKAGSIYLPCSIAGLRHPLLKIMSSSSTMTCERRCPCEQRPGIGSAMTLAVAFRSASKSQPIFVRTVQSGQSLMTAGYDVHQTGPIRSPGSAPTNHQDSLYRLRVKPNRTFFSLAIHSIPRKPKEPEQLPRRRRLAPLPAPIAPSLEKIANPVTSSSFVQNAYRGGPVPPAWTGTRAIMCCSRSYPVE